MTFDPEAFMRQHIDAPLETEFKLVPPGEYVAAIDDFDSTAVEKVDFEYKKGARAGTPGSMLKFNIPFVINDQKVKDELGRDKVIVVKQIILDVDDNGALAFGTNKNVELGRIRDAVGQNQNGKPWSMFDLRGAGPVMLKVSHVEFDRRDGTKGKRAEVDRVVRVV